MKTIKIALVDDNPAVHKKSKHSIFKLSQEPIFTKVKFEVNEFNCGTEFLDSDISFDLVLLDYEMPKMTGIKVAKELEKRGSKTRVLYLSGYDDLVTPLRQATFNSLTAGFLFKSDNEEELLYHLRNEIKKIVDVKIIMIRHYEVLKDVDTNNNKKIYYQKDINIRNILTIETGVNKSFVYMSDATEYLTDFTLKKWMEVLDGENFFLANRKVVVNLKNVEIISTRKLQLSNGESLTLSDKNTKLIKLAWSKYKEKELSN